LHGQANISASVNGIPQAVHGVHESFSAPSEENEEASLSLWWSSSANI
jgi:hypothetical protein